MFKPVWYHGGGGQPPLGRPSAAVWEGGRGRLCRPLPALTGTPVEPPQRASLPRRRRPRPVLPAPLRGALPTDRGPWGDQGSCRGSAPRPLMGGRVNSSPSLRRSWPAEARASSGGSGSHGGRRRRSSAVGLETHRPGHPAPRPALPGAAPRAGPGDRARPRGAEWVSRRLGPGGDLAPPVPGASRAGAAAGPRQAGMSYFLNCSALRRNIGLNNN